MKRMVAMMKQSFPYHMLRMTVLIALSEIISMLQKKSLTVFL